MDSFPVEWRLILTYISEMARDETSVTLIIRFIYCYDVLNI